MVDAAAITPISPGPAPKYSAKRGSVGDLDAVELSIATKPAMESNVSMLDLPLPIPHSLKTFFRNLSLSVLVIDLSSSLYLS